MVLFQRPGDGRVLIAQRQAASWHFPRMLTVVGGRLEDAKFLNESASRELAKEVGIQVAPDRLRFCQLPHFHAADGERVIGAVFTVREWEGDPYNREPDTRSELVWVDLATPPPDCHPFTHAVLTHFSTGQLYANMVAPELLGGEAG